MAWSATTADTDNVDTFAEVLCQDDFHYLYKGECLEMEKLEREKAKLEQELLVARKVIELAGKAHEILGVALPSLENDEKL